MRGEGVRIELEPEPGAVGGGDVAVLVELDTLLHADVEPPNGTGSSKKSPLEMESATWRFAACPRAEPKLCPSHRSPSDVATSASARSSVMPFRAASMRTMSKAPVAAGRP